MAAMNGPVTMTASDVRRIEALVLDWYYRFSWAAIETAAEREQAEENRCACGALKSRYLALCLSCEARR